jgi:hypothetical protein
VVHPQAAESETDDYAAVVSRRLTGSYEMEVNRAGALKRHPGISRFTLNYLEPKLRANWTANTGQRRPD